MSPTCIAGAVNIMFQLCITVGILLAQVINYVVAPLPYGWRISLGAGGVPAALLFLGTLVLPETPQFLVSKGLVEQATAVARKCFGVQDVTAAVGLMQWNHDSMT
jgi:MFS family permease